MIINRKKLVVNQLLQIDARFNAEIMATLVFVEIFAIKIILPDRILS